MGMGVHLIGLAMGGPACVGDAYMAADVLAIGESLQVGDLAFGLIHIQHVGIIEQRHAGTVVATIFKTFQALNQNRIGVLMAQISNYSTHNCNRF